VLDIGLRELQAALLGQSVTPIAHTAPMPLDGDAAAGAAA
jgi:hypothetical protein